MSVLQEWYTARTTQDAKQLHTLLVSPFFGARLHDGTICHSTEDLVSAVLSQPLDTFDLTIDSHKNDTIRFHATLHTTKETIHLFGKAVVKDGKIFHLFEDTNHGMRRIKVTCAYDGSAFHGYQRQRQQPTIQQTIEEAIQDAFGLEQGISIHASGRTDRGVHAAHQVFHFDLKTQVPGDKIAGVIGSRLPDAIHLLASEDVHPTFHSRYDIVEKEYRYKINRVRYDAIQRNYEWFVPNLDPDKLNTDAAVLVGTHDFAAFTTTANENTIRTIHAVDVDVLGEHVYLTFRGSGFLRYMVRYLVEALVRSNQGTLEGTIEDLLTSGDHSMLDKMAPAGGLYLQHVTYR